jgi:hypothetical protein
MYVDASLLEAAGNSNKLTIRLVRQTVNDMSLENEDLQPKGAEGEHHLVHALNEVSPLTTPEGQTNIQGNVSSLEGAVAGRPELAKLLSEGTVEQVQGFIATKQAELESHSAQTGLS